MTKQSPNDSNDFWSIVLQYVACYFSWIITSAIGFWLIFLLRTNLLEDILFLRVNPWQLQAIDRFFIFGAGAVWLVIVMWTEGYLRDAIELHEIGLRVRQILLIEGVIIALSFGIHFLSSTNIN